MGELYHDHPLAKYTSWRVGGLADTFFRPDNLTDLQAFFASLPENEPLTWLGLGSNVLVPDEGIAGTVILTLNRLSELTLLDNGLVYAEAGVPCAKLAKFCVKQGFEAGAFFAGIPGTVGGALRMNAGAFGGETWPCVESVALLNGVGELTRLPRSSFRYAYRQVEGVGGQFFAAGYFQFEAGGSAETHAAIKALLKKRQATQPVGTFNCGSVFRNPPGDYAARLIEAAGLKGYRVGGAVVSEKHANFVVNDGGASAKEIRTLITHVQTAVAQQFGVQLVRECIFLATHRERVNES